MVPIFLCFFSEKILTDLPGSRDWSSHLNVGRCRLKSTVPCKLPRCSKKGLARTDGGGSSYDERVSSTCVLPALPSVLPNSCPSPCYQGLARHWAASPSLVPTLQWPWAVHLEPASNSRPSLRLLLPPSLDDTVTSMSPTHPQTLLPNDAQCPKSLLFTCLTNMHSPTST